MAYDSRTGRWVYDPLDSYRGVCKQPEDRPQVALRLAALMTAQKRGHQRPEYGRHSGRIDRRNLWRASTGDDRVFSKRGEPSPTRLRLVVVLDLSGSMKGAKSSKACQMGWDLILASKRVPTVTCEVYGHTTHQFRPGEESDVAEEAREGCYGSEDFIKVVELWKPGVSRTQYHRAITATDFRGNEDGWPLKVIHDDVKRRASKGERIVIVMVSDGAPYYREGGERAAAHVRSVANDIRRQGDVVLSVSVESSYIRTIQDGMYGRQNVVQYCNDTNALLSEMAQVIGRALN